MAMRCVCVFVRKGGCAGCACVNVTTVRVPLCVCACVSVCVFVCVCVCVCVCVTRPLSSLQFIPGYEGGGNFDQIESYSVGDPFKAIQGVIPGFTPHYSEQEAIGGPQGLSG